MKKATAAVVIAGYLLSIVAGVEWAHLRRGGLAQLVQSGITLSNVQLWSLHSGHESWQQASYRITNKGALPVNYIDYEVFCHPKQDQKSSLSADGYDLDSIASYSWSYRVKPNKMVKQRLRIENRDCEYASARIRVQEVEINGWRFNTRWSSRPIILDSDRNRRYP